MMDFTLMLHVIISVILSLLSMKVPKLATWLKVLLMKIKQAKLKKKEKKKMLTMKSSKILVERDDVIRILKEYFKTDDVVHKVQGVYLYEIGVIDGIERIGGEGNE